MQFRIVNPLLQINILVTNLESYFEILVVSQQLFC